MAKYLCLSFSILIMFIIGGCDTPTPVDAASFSNADEAFYNTRYDNFQAARRQGAETTVYDTEVQFGQELARKRLPISDETILPEKIKLDLIDYAVKSQADVFMIYENGHVSEALFQNGKSPESLINSKSLAKPLGVVAIGRAIKAGYIESLDQPVADFITEWKGTAKEQIKIRHLLDMRTGLLAQASAPTREDVLNRAYLHPRHDEVIIREYPLVHQPGKRYDYSNANSELVSVVIERATEMPYQAWLSEQVLEPLGMAGGKIWLNREGGVAHSGCCVGMIAENYLKLAILVLQNGQWENAVFLDADFMQEMTSSTPENIHAAMGLYLGANYSEYRGAGNPDSGNFGAAFHSEPYVDKDLLLFDGNGNQVAYIFPSRNLVIMRLGSRPPKEIGGQPFVWDNTYIPNLVSRSLDKPR